MVQQLFGGEEIWIGKTVLLETAWELKSTLGCPAETVRQALNRLLTIENVVVDDSEGVRQAIALAEKGLEFADALHLCSMPVSAQFASFDRKFVRRAQQAGQKSIRLL
ncbi:MAG: hypothetical protein HY820_37620 [Acidobacteria bacterium]|nr:hypothetical protein [Acidobacteriota bacterium]